MESQVLYRKKVLKYGVLGRIGRHSVQHARRSNGPQILNLEKTRELRIGDDCFAVRSHHIEHNSDEKHDKESDGKKTSRFAAPKWGVTPGGDS